MKKVRFLTWLCMICALPSMSEATEINYFNSPTPPKDYPVIFAPDVVSSKEYWEEKIAFTPDGKDMFFGRHVNTEQEYFKPKLMQSKFSDGHWSSPQIASFSKGKGFGWPLIGGSGNTLFLEQFEGKMAFSKKTNGVWGEPQYIVPDVEAYKGFGLAQQTQDNHFYFHDRWERIAYSSKVKNGDYSKAKVLNSLVNPLVEFFVSPKNDYIIFQPLNWQNQMHISFRDDKGEWEMPIPLVVYFKDKEKWDAKGIGPSVSPDGKYLFFSKGGDIYWVKADFIEVLRKYKRPY